MKKTLTVLLSLFSFCASAAIEGSTFKEYQETILESAIYKNCGIQRGLKVLSQTQTVDQVDQGVQDVYYKTTLEGFLKIDQGIIDRYLIKTNSVLVDAYDHENKVWGLFIVESVECTQTH